MAWVWVVCGTCNGTGGWIVNEKIVICTACQSTGEVRKEVK